jgi:cytochrome d ubiquinol oxidase subunit I
MVGIGLLMIAASWSWLVALFRKKTDSSLMLNSLSAMTFSGLIATLAGWYVAEIGRQPWVVYGLVRTSEVVAYHSGGAVLSTLIAYLALYLALLAAWILTLRYMAGLPQENSAEGDF